VPGFATLLPTVETIGLNVKADNTSAICCYTKLGFEMIAAFKEYSLLLNRRCGLKKCDAALRLIRLVARGRE